MNSVLFRLGTILFPLQWGNKYARIDKSPHILEFIFLRLLIRLKTWLVSAIWKASDFSPTSDSPGEIRLRRRYLAFSVTPISEPENKQNLPAIRLLWVAHPKDFPVLTHSVQNALRHSRNPVTSITVVTPEPAIARATLDRIIPENTQSNFRHDEDFLPPEIRSRLDEALPSHSSWAAQQLIKVFATLEVPTHPTLVIDADTVLLRDKTWVYGDGSQLLYFRSFYNERYADFLRLWGFETIDTLKSFVTHHMLFQPEILREVTASIFGTLELGQTVDTIITSVKALGYPEFCVEYEPYGQFIAGRQDRSVRFDKYSNIGLPRPPSELELHSAIERMQRADRFNSVSFHKPDR